MSGVVRIRRDLRLGRGLQSIQIGGDDDAAITVLANAVSCIVRAQFLRQPAP